MKARRRAESPVARRSALVWRFMVFYFGRYFRRHMNGLRLARWGAPDAPARGPLVVYLNHPGWWDGIVVALAADRLLPGYEGYIPIDEEMLARYPVFGRMGAFGMDPETRAGALAFLTTADAILADPRRSLWVTAQGRFSDVRERPVGLQPGLAHLPERAPDAVFLPLAIEYGFWIERGAEAFLAFGAPIRARELLALPRPERRARLEAGLSATLDRLSADVVSREPARFRTLVAGQAGVGGVYDGWRRLGATLRGRRFHPEHGKGARGPAEAAGQVPGHVPGHHVPGHVPGRMPTGGERA